jgi:hypothetical protein
MKYTRCIAVSVVGGTVLALGIALIVLPGPAFLVIPAGLSILAIEFAWARRWLHKARGWLLGKLAPQPLPLGVLPDPTPEPIRKP